MIDEKKLIEELNKITFKAEVHNSGYNGPRTEKMLCYEDVVSIINKQPKVGEWIPVSERLPESEGIYPVTLDGTIVGEDIPFTGLSEFEDGKWIDDEEYYKCIIAWQPLPEPYQNDEQED